MLSDEQYYDLLARILVLEKRIKKLEKHSGEADFRNTPVVDGVVVAPRQPGSPHATGTSS